MTALVMLVVVVIGLVVVRMMAVLLIFRHLHTISLMVLAPIHHDMLTLLSIVTVHVEGTVRRCCVYRRSRRRRCVVSKRSSAARGRRSAVDVSVVVLIVLRIIELPRRRLVEPVRTICHLVWPRQSENGY